MGWGTGNKKDVKSPFRLTPTEKRILDIIDSGILVPMEIAQSLGWKCRNIDHLVNSATEKRRILLREEGITSPGFSSLSKARGERRMEGTK